MFGVDVDVKVCLAIGRQMKQLILLRLLKRMIIIL